MDRLMTFILISFIIAILFVSSSLNIDKQLFRESLKQNISLSSKVLKDNLLSSKDDYNLLAKGFNRDSIDSMRIDESKLLEDFNELLFRHYYNKATYNQIKKGLLAKVLVYPEYFIIANINDEWSAPYYFTFTTLDKKLVYLNSIDNTTYYYSDANLKIYNTLDAYSLTNKDKQTIIISKINKYINVYTKQTQNSDGVVVNIKNQHISDQNYVMKAQSFNPLEGITFFVVYFSNKELLVWRTLLDYRVFEVAGYTIK